MPHPHIRRLPRLGLFLLAAAVAALLLTPWSAVTAQEPGAPERDAALHDALSLDGIAGTYHGEQDGAAFTMELRVEGRFVTGELHMDGAAPDTLRGIVTARRIALLRDSTPFEIWLGQVDLPVLAGHWFGPGGRGAWRATKAGPALRVVKTVAPHVIPVGRTTADVRYTIRVANRGTEIAHDVVLADHGVPDFFAITSITIDRDGAAPATLPGGQIELPLGDIAPGEMVTVTITGDAAPRERGAYVNIAVATAADAPRSAGRAALFVAVPCDRPADADPAADRAPCRLAFDRLQSDRLRTDRLDSDRLESDRLDHATTDDTSVRDAGSDLRSESTR